MLSASLAIMELKTKDKNQMEMGCLIEKDTFINFLVFKWKGLIR